MTSDGSQNTNSTVFLYKDDSGKIDLKDRPKNGQDCTSQIYGLSSIAELSEGKYFEIGSKGKEK